MSLRLFQKWLLQPLQDSKEIFYRSNLIEYYSENMPVRQVFSAFLRKMPDIDKLLIKLYKVKNNQRHSTKLVDCYKLYLIVVELEILVGYLDNLILKNEISEIRTIEEKEKQGNELQFLKSMFDKLLLQFKKYNEFIEKAIDIETVEKTREYLLNPGKLKIILI